ncbi:ribonuclease domain-containing protein [Orbaceae bacterium ESL0721]|nr:ribonuclease domain-containing protein [Orbaceae bacterium ESL0721]
MITFDNAVQKANEYIKDSDIPLVITLQGRFSEGWFFCFQSKEYLETGESSCQSKPNIQGPGPQRIIVGQKGEMYYTSDHYKTFIKIK